MYLGPSAFGSILARSRLMNGLVESQADWRGWTWRGARRLAAAEALAAERRLPRHRGEERQCDGRPFPPPPPALAPATAEDAAEAEQALPPEESGEPDNALTASPAR